MPTLFDAAIDVPAVHKLQHVSFLVTSLLFWWAILRLPSRKHGLAALHLFLTMMAISLLGALLTLSPRLWYSAYSSPPLGFTSVEDQQIAGLVMWIPGCAVYAIAGIYFMATWISLTGMDAARGRNFFDKVGPDLNERRSAR
jgi:putative membrane protein